LKRYLFVAAVVIGFIALTELRAEAQSQVDPDQQDQLSSWSDQQVDHCRHRGRGLIIAGAVGLPLSVVMYSPVLIESVGPGRVDDDGMGVLWALFGIGTAWFVASISLLVVGLVRRSRCRRQAGYAEADLDHEPDDLLGRARLAFSPDSAIRF